jgi:hypothetical protein
VDDFLDHPLLSWVCQLRIKTQAYPTSW